MDESCELPLRSAPDEEVREILKGARVIAVVGLSDKPHRDSYRVASYLQSVGYRIIPVNPSIAESLGEKAYPSLGEVPGPVDLVEIFRRPDAVPGIVEGAIAIGAKAIWMQEGIAHAAAAEKARAAGLKVVMNRCAFKEHRRLAIPTTKGGGE